MGIKKHAAGCGQTSNHFVASLIFPFPYTGIIYKIFFTAVSSYYYNDTYFHAHCLFMLMLLTIYVTTYPYFHKKMMYLISKYWTGTWVQCLPQKSPFSTIFHISRMYKALSTIYSLLTNFRFLNCIQVCCLYLQSRGVSLTKHVTLWNWHEIVSHFL